MLTYSRFSCTFVSLIVGFGFMAACNSADSRAVMDTLTEYEKGVKTRDREAVSRLTAERIELITPFENSLLSRSEFLDRILRNDFELLDFSLTYRTSKVLGDRASIEVFESAEARFNDQTAKNGGLYTYELIRIREKWVIRRITKHL